MHREVDAAYLPTNKSTPHLHTFLFGQRSAGVERASLLGRETNNLHISCTTDCGYHSTPASQTCASPDHASWAGRSVAAIGSPLERYTRRRVIADGASLSPESFLGRSRIRRDAKLDEEILHAPEQSHVCEEVILDELDETFSP